MDKATTNSIKWHYLLPKYRLGAPVLFCLFSYLLLKTSYPLLGSAEAGSHDYAIIAISIIGGLRAGVASFVYMGTCVAFSGTTVLTRAPGGKIVGEDITDIIYDKESILIGNIQIPSQLKYWSKEGQTEIQENILSTARQVSEIFTDPRESGNASSVDIQSVRVGDNSTSKAVHISLACWGAGVVLGSLLGPTLDLSHSWVISSATLASIVGLCTMIVSATVALLVTEVRFHDYFNRLSVLFVVTLFSSMAMFVAVANSQ